MSIIRGRLRVASYTTTLFFSPPPTHCSPVPDCHPHKSTTKLATANHFPETSLPIHNISPQKESFPSTTHTLFPLQSFFLPSYPLRPLANTPNRRTRRPRSPPLLGFLPGGLGSAFGLRSVFGFVFFCFFYYSFYYYYYFFSCPFTLPTYATSLAYHGLVLRLIGIYFLCCSAVRNVFNLRY